MYCIVARLLAHLYELTTCFSSLW